MPEPRKVSHEDWLLVRPLMDLEGKAYLDAREQLSSELGLTPTQIGMLVRQLRRMARSRMVRSTLSQ